MTTDNLPIEFADEEDDNFSFRRLMNLLYKSKELIITIAKEDEAATRKSLSALKGRDAQKFKKEGLETGDEVLTFTSVAVPGEPENIKLHIRLGPRQGVVVKKLELPDNEL